MDYLVIRAPVVKKKEPERRGHGERERAYNGGLGAAPPAGSRGRAPGRVGREAPLSFELSSKQWKRKNCFFSLLCNHNKLG